MGGTLAPPRRRFPLRGHGRRGVCARAVPARLGQADGAGGLHRPVLDLSWTFPGPLLDRQKELEGCNDPSGHGTVRQVVLAASVHSCRCEQRLFTAARLRARQADLAASDERPAGWKPFSAPHRAAQHAAIARGRRLFTPPAVTAGSFCGRDAAAHVGGEAGGARGAAGPHADAVHRAGARAARAGRDLGRCGGDVGRYRGTCRR